MKEKFGLLKQYFTHPRAWAVFVSATVLFTIIEFRFTDSMAIKGNFGLGFWEAHIISQIILSILFGINMAVLIERIALSQDIRGRTIGIGTIGAFLGILVSGCAACGITLASFLGLAAFVTLLPFYGIELKVFGIILLLYSTYKLLEPVTCAVPRKRSKSL